MPFKVVSRPKSMSKIAVLPDRVKAGVAVKGKAAAYALVWEWGSTRITPGPKTTYGENPDANDSDDPSSVGYVFTAYAPNGYIRIHKQQFFEYARNAIQSLPTANMINSQTMQVVLQASLMKAATEAAQLMQQDAPIDSGLLKESIVAIVGSEVDALMSDSYRPLLIGGV